MIEKAKSCRPQSRLPAYMVSRTAFLPPPRIAIINRLTKKNDVDSPLTYNKDDDNNNYHSVPEARRPRSPQYVISVVVARPRRLTNLHVNFTKYYGT